MSDTATLTLPDDAAPKIRALYDYWLSIQPGDVPLPGRRHLDPLDIPELLPNIWMVDVVRDARAGDPLRFRFRLIGTEIVKFAGRDVTGSWLDEVVEGYQGSEAFRFHQRVVESGQPAYRRGDLLFDPDATGRTAERLYLPLAHDGRTVDILLIMTIYHGEPPRRRR